jgi:hypothetical protein
MEAQQIMKTVIKSFGILVVSAAICLGGSAKRQAAVWDSLKDPETAQQLKAFVAEKQGQASVLAEADEKEYANDNFKFKRTDCQTFFTAVNEGNWQVVSNLFSEMQNRLWSRTNTVERRGRWWQPVMESFGAVEAFAWGDEKYSKAFGDQIIQSIPPGSIYFGGTDPGRFIVTALQKSHVNGDPFFTLTQNALADGTYLQYLRSIYGGKIYIPPAEDSQRCFNDYLQGAQQRMQKHQLKPGEDVKVEEARVQVSGMVAVMEINGCMAKTIFDNNPDREFYIEESFPFDWMYPYLEPHGLILKINRRPLAQLSAEIIRTDREYWAKQVKSMVGDWLHEETSVAEIAAFGKNVFLKHDYAGFTGDRVFVENGYTHKMFSKFRTSIAGVYVWRAENTKDPEERQRMTRAADLAFRQALALCPYLPEAVKQYVDFLKTQKRDADAEAVSEMAGQFPKPKEK